MAVSLHPLGEAKARSEQNVPRPTRVSLPVEGIQSETGVIWMSGKPLDEDRHKYAQFIIETEGKNELAEKWDPILNIYSKSKPVVDPVKRKMRWKPRYWIAKLLGL